MVERNLPGLRHASSARALLARAGFTGLGRAWSCLQDPALRPYLPDPDPGGVPVPRPAAPGPPGPRGTDSLVTARLTGAQAALVEALGRTADPDLALLSLIRLCGSCTRGGPARLLADLLDAVVSPQDASEPGLRVHATRLLAVLGASQALGDFLVAHPGHLDAAAPQRAFGLPGAGADEQLLDAVRSALDGQDGATAPGRAQAVEAATAALRVAYRDRLVAVVAEDLVSGSPTGQVAVVGRQMAELADASLEAGLLVARAAVGPAADDVALAVIAMGKTGAQELNYVSDVDVVYVVGPGGPARGASASPAGREEPGGRAGQEDELVATGAEIATALARVLSATGAEPALWPLDTGLRPEGKDGALVRTLASHLAYYERWASSWEFQALLKARACAGDRELGRAYEAAVAPLVWGASQRENFVDDARAMRRRVEQESRPRPRTPAPGAGRARAGRAGRTPGRAWEVGVVRVLEDPRIKLGPGGLRDVEFTVQLLQLVHGRGDPALRVRPTLAALAALSAGGYVSRADAAALADCYRALRLLEHRAQLTRLRRTHDLPQRPEDLRRIGRGIDRDRLADPARLVAVFRDLKRQVRGLHEEIYYRPLLGAAAGLSADEMTLSPDAARERLAAFGYLDPDGALRHIQALTEGVTRRASIQRQLLPVMIGWLADGPDPDSGLLSFRQLSEVIGGSHWYLGMLRDSPHAAQRLCHVLSGARWTAVRLAEHPEATAWLDDDAELRPRSRQALTEEVARIVGRRDLGGGAGGRAEELERRAVEAVQAVVGVRTRELLRAALADSLDGVDPNRTARILTDATDAVIGGALEVATALVVARRGGAGRGGTPGGATGTWAGALARHAVIAMGRLGGEETSYASDADVMFVHEACPGVEAVDAAREAEAVARTTQRLLKGALPHPVDVDADLRPEGRQGPMSRSLSSCAEYYGRWSAVWERQALLRARPCAGDPGLGRRFEELIDPLRWSAEGLDDDALRQIRRLKARMEAERMPRGVEPARHLKLGPGGISDVEWAAQVLQLQHAGRVPGLRTTSTTEALRAASEAGLLSADQAGELMGAWILATRVRAANVLGTGRDSGARVDVLPSDVRGVRVVGWLLRVSSGGGRDLEDLYRRGARHARAVMEQVVYGPDPVDPASRPPATPRSGVSRRGWGEPGRGGPARRPGRR